MEDIYYYDADDQAEYDMMGKTKKLICFIRTVQIITSPTWSQWNRRLYLQIILSKIQINK